MEVPFFNIFVTSHFSTNDIDFKCVFDSDKFSEREKKEFDTVTHIAELNSVFFDKKSILMPSKEKLMDVVLLLTLGMGKHIHCNKISFNVLKKSSSLELFLSHEIGDYLETSLKNLQTIEDKEPALFSVFKTAFFLFYQTKFYTYYDDIEIILLMNCFEFLLASIYRIKNQLPDENDVPFVVGYNDLISKFEYQTFINKKLEKEIPPEILESENFRKNRNLKFSKFSDQFRKMRNWISHGMYNKKPEFDYPTSTSTYAFSWRLEEFIRIILIDIIYGRPYDRKFDLLYQLILENNVNITLTPEFPKLRFK
jgi:hypothetical protein